MKSAAIMLALILASVPWSHAEEHCSLDELNSSGGAWVLFSSFRGGDFSSSVHAVRIDGTGECRISSHPSGKPGCLDAVPSEDGTRVVFTRGGDGTHQTAVWSMQGDGTGEVRLTERIMTRFRNGRAWPSVSPDGDWLLYVEESDSRRLLRLLDLSAGTILDLGPGEFPSWSPDGEWISYSAEHEERSQVWLVRSDGSDRRVLTRGTASAYSSWSPDGTRLVFCRKIGERYDLFTIGADGEDLMSLTQTPERSEKDPSWSPDGQYIAFVTKPADAPDSWQRSVFVLSIGGGAARQLTPSEFNDTRPVWILPSE